MRCWVCGGAEFREGVILWDELCAQWQLSPEERAYVDRQQATHCVTCGSNLRSIVLAKGMLSAFGAPGPFIPWITSPAAADLSVLGINEAGALTPTLATLPGHVLGRYPDVDMHAMPYPDASFDVVIHSDTLEHVAQPIRALSECRRVLRPGGILAFTVPTIVGRLSRDRTGLPPSFHGDPTTASMDYAVVTEYGADMWTHVIRAGFEAVTTHTFSFPAALAMTARA